MAIITDKLDQDARTYTILRRLIAETGWRYAPQYALAFALTATVALSTTGVAYFAGEVFRAVFEEKNEALLGQVAFGVAALFTIRGLATFGSSVLLTQIGNAIILETQIKMFGKVVRQEPSFLSQSSSGEITTLINNSGVQMQRVLNTIVLSIGRDILTLVGLLSFMIWTNWQMSLMMMAGIPIIIVVINGITKRLRNIGRRHLEVSASLANRIRGAVQGIRVVKAFRMEDQIGSMLAANAEEMRRLGNKQAIVASRLAPFMEIVAGVVFGLAIGLGGSQFLAIDGGSSAGLVSFIAAALLAYDPARRIGVARTNLERGLIGVRLMYDFLDQNVSNPDWPGSTPLELAKGEIRFDKVRFGYDADKPVLHGVSFTAPAGKTTALVGRSGSGKTTMANLVQRFWRVDSGQILIDDQNIDKVQVATLRDSMAYVGQDAYVFDGTIRENIVAGDVGASDEAVRAAAKAAGALEFIEALPNGFENKAGELGANLSGGQRQRIAIARAMLRNAPIVVLDEPTSALDTETERAIQASLEELATGRTTIVIAHRLSTIEHADHIVVLEDGRVVEQGDHASLVTAQGAYARLYQQKSEDADLEDPVE